MCVSLLCWVRQHTWVCQHLLMMVEIWLNWLTVCITVILVPDVGMKLCSVLYPNNMTDWQILYVLSSSLRNSIGLSASRKTKGWEGSHSEPKWPELCNHPHHTLRFARYRNKDLMWSWILISKGSLDRYVCVCVCVCVACHGAHEQASLVVRKRFRDLPIGALKVLCTRSHLIRFKVLRSESVRFLML